MKISMLLLLTLFSFPTALFSQEYVIAVDTTLTYQKITGWEASEFIAVSCDPDFDIKRDSIVKKAVNEVGITRIRLEVRSSTENNVDYYKIWKDKGCPNTSTNIDYQEWRGARYATVNDNNDTLIQWDGFKFTDLDEKIERIVIPFKNEMAKRGEKLFVNVCYVAFTSQIKQGIYIHHNADEYAEFVLATYLHMRDKYNLIPDAWEVVLEPDNVSQWNGTKLGMAISKSAERLIKYGFKPRFIAPSNMNMTNAVTWFDEMINVKGVVENLEEISYHRYSGVKLSSLTAIAERAKNHKINSSMLEWWFGNSTYQVLHEDLTIGNNSAFQEAALSGLFDITKLATGNYSFKINKTTDFNRVYYNLFRPGDIRVAAQSNRMGLKPIAFRNIKKMYALAIVAEATGVVRITGIPDGEYVVSLHHQDIAKRETANIISKNGELVFSIKNTGLISIKQLNSLTTGKFSLEQPESITVYPNPATDCITIAGITGTGTISNLAGQTIWTGHLFPGVKLDISDFPCGLFLLRIENGPNMQVSKFLVQNP